MKKIVVTGTHGVGKTTLAHQVCVALKERNLNTAIIEEKARSCPFPLNESSTTETEVWIIHTQIKAELQAKAEKYEVAVIDRCSLDAIVYWDDISVNKRHPYFEPMRDVALEWVNTYDMIILAEPSSDTDDFAVDAVRDSCIIYRNRIRDLFRSYMELLPKEMHSKIICVQSDDIFGREGAYSPAVNQILAHEAFPSSEHEPLFMTRA